MKITWIVPDVYGFLLDEIGALRGRVDSLRVLSGSPVPEEVRKKYPDVDFYECPERRLFFFGAESALYKELLRLHGWRRMLTSGWHTRKIAEIYRQLLSLERENPSDVIHSHFAHPGGVGGMLLRDRSQVMTLRGYDILTTGSYGSLWNPFYRNNLIHYYGKHGMITTGSRFSNLRARQILGSQADIRYLQQGLAATSFDAAGIHSRVSLGIAADDSVLLGVGNLTGVKNWSLMLKAFGKVVERQRGGVHLIVCGDGHQRSQLEHQAEVLGVSQQVHFMGRLTREELTDVYQLADLFVHTSMSEGFGNVILEAMLHELPVVASPVGVAPDVIRHGQNGWLPELGDLDSLVANLLNALERIPEMAESCRENREMVLEQFSMECRIDGFLGLYQEAIRSCGESQE